MKILIQCLLLKYNKYVTLIMLNLITIKFCILLAYLIINYHAQIIGIIYENHLAGTGTNVLYISQN